MPALPEVFLQRLQQIVPEERLNGVLQSFQQPSAVSVRINPLKIKRMEALESLAHTGIKWHPVPWSEDALILEEVEKKRLNGLDLVKKGQLYIQGLSSMLPAALLAPGSTDRVLDLCAAPGSKTTQMAARMQNRGTIVAVEAVRNRFYKLKSVAALLGAQNVEFKITDGRRFRSAELFDKVLVDAPCSSEGRFKTFDKKTFAYWSPRKIKEMVRKQRGLILAASRLLKPGGILVYSTCTFAPEENEGIIDWLLRKTSDMLKVRPVAAKGVETVPALTGWNKRRYHPDVQHCMRVLPDGCMEGFFVAKIERK